VGEMCVSASMIIIVPLAPSVLSASDA